MSSEIANCKETLISMTNGGVIDGFDYVQKMVRTIVQQKAKNVPIGYMHCKPLKKSSQ
jgi:hypothetical protein